MDIQLPKGKKLYFLSDAHLGFPDSESSLVREKLLVRFLESIRHEAAHLFLVGDLFDFWFDYRFVVPKGFTRFLGKLAELSDDGLPISFFTGNHDMWVFDYLPQELGIPVYRDPISFTCRERSFLIGHGDGLGPGDYGYKLLRAVFRNRLCQWLFGALHPTIGMGLGTGWSVSAKHRKMNKGVVFEGEKELIWQYCQTYHQLQPTDFYIFGHRHIPMDLPVGQTGRHVNIGDWITYFTYAVFDGYELSLMQLDPLTFQSAPCGVAERNQTKDVR